MHKHLTKEQIMNDIEVDTYLRRRPKEILLGEGKPHDDSRIDFFYLTRESYNTAFVLLKESINNLIVEYYRGESQFFDKYINLLQKYKKTFRLTERLCDFFYEVRKIAIEAYPKHQIKFYDDYMPPEEIVFYRRRRVKAR